MFENKHYIRLNENNLVIKAFSDAFEQPADGDIECTIENAAVLYAGQDFAPGSRHFGPQLSDFNMVTRLWKYKFENGQVTARTESDMKDTAEYVQALLKQKENQVTSKTNGFYASKRFTFNSKSFSASSNAQSNWMALALASQMGTLAAENRIAEQNDIDYMLAAADVPAFLAVAFSHAKVIHNAHMDTMKALRALVSGTDHTADRAALDAWSDTRT